jgi:hypothetical protein
MVGKAAKEAMAMIRPPPSLRSHYLTRIRILPPAHLPASFYTNRFGCALLIKVNRLGFHEWLQALEGMVFMAQWGYSCKRKLKENANRSVRM